MSNKVPPKQNINSAPWSFYQSQEAQPTLSIKSLKESTSLYLYNYNTGEEVELEVIPDAVSAAYTSRILKQAPFGVMHPINYYTGGNTKSISFSMDLHEDLHGVKVNGQNSIYALIDLIKSMSEPKTSNGKLMEPLVYLQLGNQFAGKGHISTDINLNAPFRQGRYIYISISFNFTYHEDFDIANVEIIDNTYTAVLEGITADILGVDTDNFDDFYKQNFDYNYVISQVFADSKISNYLNTVGNQPIYREAVTAAQTGDIETYFSSIESTFGSLAGRVDVNSAFKVLGILTLIVELSNIIRPLTDISVTIQNLKILQNKISERRSRVIGMTRGPSGTFYDDEGPTSVILNAAERQQLLEVLLNLSDIVANQIKAYSVLQGASQ